MSEREKMTAGKIYDCFDEEITFSIKKAYNLCLEYNQTPRGNPRRDEIIKELLPNLGENGYLNGPIWFDYGFNFHTGKNFYANYNFVVMDCAKTTIGDNVFIGPNVTLAGPMHALLKEERKLTPDNDGILHDYEYAKPIVIEDDVWICSNVTICGGVTIHSGAVIGAGSVVTKDIPADTLAVGNPCKPIRKITKEDSVKLKKELY